MGVTNDIAEKLPGVWWLKVALRTCGLAPWSSTSKLAHSIVFIGLFFNWFEAFRCLVILFYHLFATTDQSKDHLQTRLFHIFITIYIWNSAINRTVCTYLWTKARGRRVLSKLRDVVLTKLETISNETKRKLSRVNVVTVLSMAIFVMLNVASTVTMMWTGRERHGASMFFVSNWLEKMNITFISTKTANAIQLAIHLFIDSSFLFNAILLGCIMCFAELFQDLNRKIQKQTSVENLKEEEEETLATISLSEIRQEFSTLAHAVEKLDKVSNFVTLSTMSTCFISALLGIFVLIWQAPQAPLIYIWILWLIACFAKILFYYAICSYLSNSSSEVIDTVVQLPDDRFEHDEASVRHMMFFYAMSNSDRVGISLFGIIFIRKSIILTVSLNFQPCFHLNNNLFFV